jgi:hypothetical protein
MNYQHNSFEEEMLRAFRWRRSALHEIHHAIGRARRKPRTTIRVVPTGPARITWYECAKCGRPAALNGETPPRCPVCGVPAVAHAWTRPNREASARRPTRWTHVAVASPFEPLPDGEYRIVRRDPATAATALAVRTNIGEPPSYSRIAGLLRPRKQGRYILGTREQRESSTHFQRQLRARENSTRVPQQSLLRSSLNRPSGRVPGSSRGARPSSSGCASRE